MKRTLISLTLFATLLAATLLPACQRDRIIPDDTLAEIFHDAFLINAYVGAEHLSLDSLEIYEPVFQKYGYTAEDIRRTVGNFSRRKSAKLGTVVNVAIERLDKESKEWNRKVVILDTIREYSLRKFSRTVYEDTLITVKRRADSTRLHLVIEPVPAGTYNIAYNYEREEDLSKYRREASLCFERADSSRFGRQSFYLRKSEKVRRVLRADTTAARLVLNLGTFSGKPPKEVDMEIRNLEIVYEPTEQMAVDSLFDRYVEIKIFADDFMPRSAQDSLASAVDSLRLD